MSKDKDLENLLKPLKDIQPTELQLQKWQSAVGSQLPQKKRALSLQWALQLAVACLIGFIVGALMFKAQPGQEPSSNFARISMGDATFEYTHDNLD